MMGKILWICKESFTSIVNYSLPFFADYKNEALFIHPTESLLKDDTHVSFLALNPDLQVYTLDEAAFDYVDRIKLNTDIKTVELLQPFIDKYCQIVSWGELLMSSQIFTTPYHYRFYFGDLKESHKELWVLLLFQYFEDLLIKAKPNFIMDFDNSEIGRSVLWLIAQNMNIPYITIEHMRYEGYIMPTFTLGRHTDAFFKKGFQTHEASSESILAVKRYRESSQIMNKDYTLNKTAKKQNAPFINDLKRLIYYQAHTAQKAFQKAKLLGWNFRFPFIANYLMSSKFFVNTIIKERYLLSKYNRIFELPVENEHYVYFPLHLIPESTTLIKAPFYPNEEEVIKAVSKALPISWKLYIKEHGAMVGERPLKFYQKLRRLSNIKFIRIDAFDDPKDWIMRSEGVITLAGTSAFEAAMLGKPSIVLGNVPFELIKNVIKCNDFTMLPKIISTYFVRNKNFDNLLECAKYIDIIDKFGEKVKFTYLHNQTLKGLVKRKKTLDEDVNKEILSLTNVLKKGIFLTKKNDL